MKTPEVILEAIKNNKGIGSSQLAEKFHLSRKTVAVHLKKLLENELIVKIGSTKNARYNVPSGKRHIKTHYIALNKKIFELNEDQVFLEIDFRLGLRKQLSEKAYSIAQYTFTEMLNNAIDHSKSKNVDIQAQVKHGNFSFVIRDFGVGIYKNIQKKFHLKNQYEALDHVLKGKQTTQPRQHSGEGLFFTSRIADLFLIRSQRIDLEIDNLKKDYTVREKRFLRGTEITFQIKIQTRKTLKNLFDQYADEHFEFKNGEMRVRIHQQTGNFSRSQARRLAHGLEKYDRIVFDFHNVKEVGQAFADEIFRVFQNRYPNITLSFANAIAPVEFMILRAIRGSSRQR